MTRSALVVLVLALATHGLSAQPLSGAKLESFSRVAGTFSLANRTWTVQLYGQRAVWPAEAAHTASDWDETVERFEIRDAAGTIAYQRTILEPGERVQVDETGVQPLYWVSAQPVEGRTGRALLVSWGAEPSAPRSCSWFQLFTVRNQQLVSFAEPRCEELEFAKMSGETVTLKYDDAFQFDYFDTLHWTGNFDVVVPVRVNFGLTLLLHGQLTMHLGMPRLCEFPVRAERLPSDEKQTFVRLFPEPAAGVPKHIVVTPATHIQFLSAAGPCTADSGQPFGVDLTERPWLKLSVDGQVGWIRDPEDLWAVGLPDIG